MNDALANVSLEIAARAAAKYLAKNSTVTPGQLFEVYEFVEQEIKRDLNQALDDARDALACDMTQAAEQTFAASMVICGLNGAKAFLAVHPEFKKAGVA